MNQERKAAVALLIAALIVIAGAAYVLSKGPRIVPLHTPMAALQSEVLGDGVTLRITLVAIDRNDVDFESCKIAVFAPENQTGILDLKNITWVGNDSAIYSMSGGYSIKMNRTGPHDHWSAGDQVEISAQTGKLASGTWGVGIVYSPSGGSSAYVQRVID